MIDRAVADGVPGGIVLGDSWYGRSHRFRSAIRDHGLHYALGIMPTQKMWRLDKLERRIPDAEDARTIAARLGDKAFRRVTWRNGTMADRRKLSSRFAFCRVKVATDDGTEPAQREAIWLLIEWPDGEAEPTKFALTTLRRQMSKKQLVRLFKERYRTERVYEEMKGELLQRSSELTHLCS
jgi:SRSO17 transposase